MNANRVAKNAEVKELNERFSKEELVVVTHYAGLTVSKLSELRAELRKEGATFKITKNSLAKIALKDTKFEAISDMFAGPTAVATSADPVAAAKIAYDFSKKNDKLVIVGGALGNMVLDAKGVEALAKLPSLDALRSKLIGIIQAPATKVAVLLQTPARNMVGVTKAYGEKV
jgi:large subunit ribosomal protein L10